MPAHAIVLEFPIIYDDKLGNGIFCEALSGITGEITCSANNRRIIVSNFNAFTPSSTNKISLRFNKVINPNYVLNENSGYFHLGTQIQNADNFIDYNGKAAILQTLKAPG